MLRDEVLLQEYYATEPWKLLVSCVLLNQTGRRQVDTVIDSLFEVYPTPVDMANAAVEDIAVVIAPLGLQNRRAATLQRMSTEYVDLRAAYGDDAIPWKEVEGLPGVGDYATESYRIFHLKDYSRFRCGDKEIRAWMMHQLRAQQRGDENAVELVFQSGPAEWTQPGEKMVEEGWG